MRDKSIFQEWWEWPDKREKWLFPVWGLVGAALLWAAYVAAIVLAAALGVK